MQDKLEDFRKSMIEAAKEWFEENQTASDELALEDAEIATAIENIEVAIDEARHSRRLAYLFNLLDPAEDDAVRKPVKELGSKQLEAASRHAAENQWAKRPGDSKLTAIEWLVHHYGIWIPGLLRHELKALDADLYEAVRAKLRNDASAPDIPTRKDNRNRKLAHLSEQDMSREEKIEAMGRYAHSGHSRESYQRKKKKERELQSASP